MSYEPVSDRPKTAQEYWENPPVQAAERAASKRFPLNRKMDHQSYMDFAEVYADYIADYEKSFDHQRGSRK